MLPLTPDPAGTVAAAGAAPALKVMVLPLTTRTSPSFGAAAAVRSVAAFVPVSSSVLASLAAPSPAVDAVPTSAAATPPSVVALVIGEAPPAVPLASDVADRRCAGVGRGAAQIGWSCAGDRRRDVRLGGIADGGLQRLDGERLRGIDQLLQRGDAGVGGLQDLHAVADAVEQVADVAGAAIERLGGEDSWWDCREPYSPSCPSKDGSAWWRGGRRSTEARAGSDEPMLREQCRTFGYLSGLNRLYAG